MKQKLGWVIGETVNLEEGHWLEFAGEVRLLEKQMVVG